MDLRDFVAAALSDVLLGVQDAQSNTRKHPTDAKVSPQLENVDTRSVKVAGRHQPVTMIKFDVAVSVSTRGEAGADAKASISVLGVELGGAGGSAAIEHTRGHQSRISFEVPVALPRDAKFEETRASS